MLDVAIDDTGLGQNGGNEDANVLSVANDWTLLSVVNDSTLQFLEFPFEIQSEGVYVQSLVFNGWTRSVSITVYRYN